MMKVGIVTIIDQYNYGNRLQNFAVMEIFKSYGIEVVTINIRIKEGYRPYKEKGLVKIVRTVLPVPIFFGLGDFVLQRCKNKHLNKRRKNFVQFTKQRINTINYFVKKYSEIAEIKELEQFDFFITGSDQVWNPKFAGAAYHFLTFAPPCKRIAFIASMGVAELTLEEKERYANLLMEMKYISVRERHAVKIIENVTGKKVDCFFDPVLLLSQEEWKNNMEAPGVDLPERYLLSFFLGEEPKKTIDEYSKTRNLTVIHMNRKEYKKYYALNPAQLLFLINHAETVLTDSFHITAFSLIFKKQFRVYKRKQSGMDNMFSRIENLLERLALEKCIQDDGEILDDVFISKENYERIHSVLQRERDVVDRKMKDIMELTNGMA